MHGTADARTVARQYVEAWTRGDRDEVWTVLAPDAAVEWNLAVRPDPNRLVRVLQQVAGASRQVTLASETYADDRAALVYDCATAFGSVRTAEFLRVSDGWVREVRQVYDLTAVQRYLPELLA